MTLEEKISLACDGDLADTNQGKQIRASLTLAEVLITTAEIAD